MAWRMGGPEVKSDQATLNGSLSIRPAAVSSACAPVPAWSPMCSVTLETSACAALAVPDEVAVAPPAEDDELDEQPATAARASSAEAATHRRGRVKDGRATRSVRSISIVLP